MEKLRTLYSSLGIELTEYIFVQSKKNKNAPCSLRLNIEGTSLGANGKGKNIDAALCSAYSELTERLQCLALIPLRNDDFQYSPDEIFKEIESLSDEEIEYIKRTFSSVISEQSISTKTLKKNLILLSQTSSNPNYTKENHKLSFVPFYDVLNDKITYLPLKFVLMKNHTNGMAAGNTYEETLVQGISEIFERYSTKQVILNEYSLPTIPEKYYKKYIELERIISYLKNNNYDVIVKDASLDKKIPVVMVLFIDKKNNRFSFQFGAHPDFPIAVERAFTEFLQGYSVENVDDSVNTVIEHKIESFDESIYREQLITRGKLSFLDLNHPIFEKLVSDSSKFSLNIDFLSSNINKNNKLLLKEMINISKNLSSNLFVRNMSFLGHNSFIIEIPEVSELQVNADKYIYKNYCEYKFKNYLSKKYPEIAITADEIISSIMISPSLYYDFSYYFVPKIPNLFIAAVAYLEKGDVEKTIELLQTVKAHDKSFKDNSLLVDTLVSVLSGKCTLEQISDDKLKVQVKSFIQNPLQQLFSFIDENYPVVTRKSKRKEKIIQNVKNILIEKYIENVPNQDDLRIFFKEIMS